MANMIRFSVTSRDPSPQIRPQGGSQLGAGLASAQSSTSTLSSTLHSVPLGQRREPSSPLLPSISEPGTILVDDQGELYCDIPQSPFAFLQARLCRHIGSVDLSHFRTARTASSYAYNDDSSQASSGTGGSESGDEMGSSPDDGDSVYSTTLDSPSFMEASGSARNLAMSEPLLLYCSCNEATRGKVNPASPCPQCHHIVPPRPTKSGDDIQRENANKVLSSLSEERDWNKAFQALIELGDSEEKFSELRHLAQDFLDVATNCSKLIVDEMNTVPERKLIPPINIGGLAGGSKFICKNILFKFALDVELDNRKGWLYGGARPHDEYAMKAAKHELRGLVYYASTGVAGVCFPLMVLVNYKGFRIIAEALLPINKDTIVYGSSDGGKTGKTFAKDPLLNQRIEKIGKSLHLLQHTVGGVDLYGPGDQEIHQGLDGRYYCIDLARVFPSEAPAVIPKTKPKNSRSVFYKLLRPEFVLRYPGSLTSDGFCAMGRNDPNHHRNNGELVKATLMLYNSTIPKFAETLTELDLVPFTVEFSRSVVQTIHENGINLRHLGRIRKAVRSERMKQLLLTEAVARVAKNQAREAMRDKLKSSGSVSEEQIKEIIANHFTQIVNLDDEEFWIHITKLLANSFEDVLTPKEAHSNWNADLNLLFLVTRLCELLNVTLTEESWKEFSVNPQNFSFLYFDIETVLAQTSFMNVLNEAEGMSLFLMSKNRKKTERLRLLNMATVKFELACKSQYNNTRAQYMLGRVSYRLAKAVGPHNDPFVPKLESALDRFEQCTSSLNKSVVVPSEFFYYFGKTALLLAQHSVTSQNVTSGLTLFRRTAEAFKSAIIANRVLLPQILKKLELTFVIATRFQLSDLFGGCAELCVSVLNAMRSVADPSLENHYERKLRESEPRSIFELKVLLLRVRSLIEKHRLVKVMETFLNNTEKDGLSHESIMRGVEVMRIQNQTVDALCDVFSLSWESVHNEEAIRLLTKELPPAMQLSKHSTKLQRKLDLWCEQIKAITFNEAHTDVLMQAVLPKFKSLESLSLHTTVELNSSTLLGHLHVLSSLVEVDFSGCSFVNDNFLKALSKTATKLTLLDLSRCSEVGNDGLGAILLANALTLRKLRLSGTMDVHIQRSKSPKLKQSQLAVTRGSPKVGYSSLVPFLKASKSMEELNLEYSLTSPHDLSIDSICAPSFLRQLRILRLLGCYSVTDKHLSEIATHCLLVTELSIGSKVISNSGIIALSKSDFIGNLTYLSLRGLSVSEDSFSPLLSRLKWIRTLSINGCFGLTDVALSSLKPEPGCLTELSLSGCENVAGYSFSSILHNCSKLESLDLSFTQPMRDLAVFFIANLRVLHSLDISHCPSLNNDTCLQEFLHALPWLSIFSIESQKEITDETVRCLSVHNKRLEVLNLADCISLSDRAFAHLESLKELKSLNISQCPQLSLTKAHALQNKLLFLDSLVLPKFSKSASI